MYNKDTFIVIRVAGVVTSFNTKYYTVIGTNVVTNDEHCKPVATLK